MDRHIKFMATLKKQAQIGGMKGMKGALLAGGLVGAATVGAQGLVMGIRKAYNVLASGKRFEGMLDVNPSLKKEDPNKVRLAFNTLNRLNPTFAKDPLVAGTFVRKTLDTDIGGGMAVDPATASMLTGSAGTAAMPDIGRSMGVVMAKGLSSAVDKDPQIHKHEHTYGEQAPRVTKHYQMPRGEVPPE
jgi:hypothetical protein